MHRVPGAESSLPLQSETTPSIVRGACPHDCPDTCATITEVEDGHAVRFYADPLHHFTQGWLCAKVRPYLERVYHPERLLYPLRRKGTKGGAHWERISWEEAIQEIAARWQHIIATEGPAAILPYSYSGTLGMLQLDVCDQRLWNRMGTSGLLRSICGAAAEAAVNATLGARQAPDAADVLHSNLVIIWGHNPASTGPHFVPLLRQARRKGCYIVVVDPRRTLTARSADEHIQPRPATDGALALGLMHVIFREGLHDQAWLDANTIGWRELKARTDEYPPERVAGITGIASQTIASLGRRIGASKPFMLKFADGVQRHANGGQTVRALCCLPAIVGQIGIRGGGVSYSTSGYVHWDESALGHASECPPTPRVINMNRIGAALTGEITDPPIASLYVYCANPVASAPNAGLTIAGLQREDLFTVVHELFMTDTAQYADIVLPATSQLEQVDLHKPYGQRSLLYNAPAIAPMGEAKSNWEVMRLLSAALGYSEPWLAQSGEEVIAEVLDATRAHNPLLAGITLQRLRAEGSVPLSFSPGKEVPFADLRFPTPSGKVELYSEAMVAAGVDPLPEYIEPAEFMGEKTSGQLILISGAAHHFVSTSLANLASLRAKEGAPYLELHPEDAARAGIESGDMVIVESKRGSCQLRAIVTTNVAQGVAIAPKGNWQNLSPDGRNINWTTSDALADVGGQSTFHSNLVTVRPAQRKTGKREPAAAAGADRPS
jgi:anaerobic selenocysteine-containing dehydrogenase